MKKRLLAAAIMAALTISTATAFAAPVITGDAQTMIQTEKNKGDYSDARIRLNFDFDLGDGMYAHSRIMGIDQQMRGTSLNYAEAGTGSKGASVNMEQMYIGAKLGQVDAKFGRQPVEVGRGMLADINGIVGVSLGASSGQFDVYGFAGRSEGNDVTAAKVSSHMEKLNMGVGYLKKEATNYWAVDADTKIDKNIVLSGVYMANDTDNANGFIVKATAGEAVKKGDTSYAISYRNIEDKAVDGDWVTNGAFANSKGIRLEAKHKLTNATTLWVYQDITKKASDETVKPNQFRAEIDVNF